MFHRPYNCFPTYPNKESLIKSSLIKPYNPLLGHGREMKYQSAKIVDLEKIAELFHNNK
jgi:hypothetical protein